MRTATRTRIQRWITEGRASINGSAVRRPSARVPSGAVLTIAVPTRAALRAVVAEPLLPGVLDILYEDAVLLAVNKPPGLVVHPSYKHASGTLINGLLWHARDWPEGERPSLVGRLDKQTSGVVIAAKSRAMHAKLQRALSSRDAQKDYLALVYGRVNSRRGDIRLRLRRKPGDRRLVVASRTEGAASVTRFERMAVAAAPHCGLSLLRCRLVTGRMHQIRVHLAARGWPIVGDARYGEPRWNAVQDAALAETLRSFPRQALHAWRVGFNHPVTGQRTMVEAPVPRDVLELIERSGLRAGLVAAEWQAERR
jgi:23S rRNA pseudouridine1911/1915/1917 synthase